MYYYFSDAKGDMLYQGLERSDKAIERIDSALEAIDRGQEMTDQRIDNKQFEWQGT